MDFYWIIAKYEDEGPEIAALRGGMFFTTRTNGSGEVVGISDDDEYVEVLAGPLSAPTPPPGYRDGEEA